MRPTIKDIAAECGLSPTAVSLVLNNRPNRLSDESRGRIRAAAERFGYKTPSAVRAPHGKRTLNLGQIIPDISNFFFANLVRGVEAVANDNQYSLFVHCSENDPARELLAIRSMLEKGVDGLLITTSTQDDPSVLKSTFHAMPNVPVILVDRVIPTLAYSSMTFNHRKGGYLATKQLLDQGHTRIACLTGGPLFSPNIAQRIDGYRWAFSEAGLEPPEDALFVGDYSSASGYRMADAILEGDFSAVFSCNDMMAFGLYKRARERNIRIPQELSVVGFDDIEFSDLIDPPLTTVRQSSYDLGYEAAKRLILEIETPSLFHQSIFFEPALVMRQSTRAL